MVEFSYVGTQIIPPGQSVTFNANPVPCRRGLVWWRPGTGAVSLAGVRDRNQGCGCCQPCTSNYLAEFHANIAVPTGETVGPISLAFAIDGVNLPESTMTATPAAVEEFFNVAAGDNIAIRCGCCQTLTVTNVSDIPVSVANANLLVSK